MQQQPNQVLKVEPCDICGDVGFAEVIVICSKCNVTREHAYCMRICLTNIPEDWFCETCQPKDGTTVMKSEGPKTNEEGINVRDKVVIETGHMTHNTSTKELRRSIREKIPNSKLKDYVCG